MTPAAWVYLSLFLYIATVAAIAWRSNKRP